MTEHIEHIRAEALFVSTLHRTPNPDPTEVRTAVAGSLRQYGSRGCATRTAAEYGEYPDTAPARMTWALHAVRASYPCARTCAAA